MLCNFESKEDIWILVDELVKFMIGDEDSFRLWIM